MKTKPIPMTEWASVGSYTIRLYQAKDAVVFDTGILHPTYVRAVRILVEYSNHSPSPLKFRLNQWLLFDTDGFSYDFELRRQFYESDASRKLQEGVLQPDHQAKGWVAFQLPPEAQVAYVQFRPGYLSDEVVNFDLHFSPETAVNSQAAAPASPLQPGQAYLLQKPLSDFFGNPFLPDTPLTYIKQYPPYEGLHILIFAEATIYLHQKEHEDILAHLSRYFKANQ